MGIDIISLSPQLRQQAIRKMMAQGRSVALPDANKYHSAPTESNGIRFDSKKEAARYGDLMLMLQSRQISDLRLQVNFTLQEGYTTADGKRIRPIVYKADFTYKRGKELVVEDVKSVATKTKTYLMKRKMLQEKYGLDITEV